MATSGVISHILIKMLEYEIVHTITDWYDGARAGVADLNGMPHYYENRWNEEKNEWNEIYLLKQIDAETFALAIEDWEIWLRWECAFKEDKTTQETHPTLPDERQRHKEIENVLSNRLIIDANSCLKVKADFVYGQPTKVKWIVESGI